MEQVLGENKITFSDKLMDVVYWCGVPYLVETKNLHAFTRAATSYKNSCNPQNWKIRQRVTIGQEFYSTSNKKR